MFYLLGYLLRAYGMRHLKLQVKRFTSTFEQVSLTRRGICAHTHREMLAMVDKCTLVFSLEYLLGWGFWSVKTMPARWPANTQLARWNVLTVGKIGPAKQLLYYILHVLQQCFPWARIYNKHTKEGWKTQQQRPTLQPKQPIKTHNRQRRDYIAGYRSTLERCDRFGASLFVTLSRTLGATTSMFL